MISFTEGNEGNEETNGDWKFIVDCREVECSLTVQSVAQRPVWLGWQGQLANFVRGAHRDQVGCGLEQPALGVVRELAVVDRVVGAPGVFDPEGLAATMSNDEVAETVADAFGAGA